MPAAHNEALAEEEITAELRRQQESNWDRVILNQLYGEEIPEFVTAMAAYTLIRQGQPIGDARWIADFGSTRALDADACNPTRFVDVEVAGTRRRGVLKIMGHAKEPGEGPALVAMRDAGVTVPEVLGYSELTLPSGARAVVLVSEYLEGHTIDPRYLGDPAMERTDPWPVIDRAYELVEGLAPLRQSAIKPRRDDHRTFADRLGLHFDQTMPNLELHGIGNFEQRANVLAVLEALARGDDAQLLHGDPAPGNWLRTQDGSIVSFDPRGEIYGTPECDVAGILVQYVDAYAAEQGLPNSHGQAVAAMVDAMVARCAEHGDTLDPVRLRAAVGVHLVLWSGYAIPSPERVQLIADGQRPDDVFVDRGQLKQGRLAAWQRFLTGYECMKDFMRTPEFERAAPQQDVARSLGS